MFVIELVYKVDLAQIDAHMKEHVAFLRKHYAAGTFVISGRKSRATAASSSRSASAAPSMRSCARIRSSRAASPTIG
jgi:uncharacterized protein YciI